jgi:dolichol-phosphate mannosyltransferase
MISEFAPSLSKEERPQRTLVGVVSFNQAEEIGAFLTKLRQFHSPLDTLVVDDGSSDGSERIARELGYRVLIHERNKGVGAAIRTAVHFARREQYSLFVVMAANGKMLPQELSRLLQPILNDTADYVSGSRFMPGGSSPGLSRFRRLAIPAFSRCMSPILRRRMSDITCGFRAFKLALLDHPQIDIEQEWLDRYELEYYLLYWMCRLPVRIQEVPVTISYSHLSRGRYSKIRPFSGWWSMIRPLLLLASGFRR